MDVDPSLLADYKGSFWRRERMRMFLELSGATAKTTILDLGGCDHTWNGTGLEANVTLLNLAQNMPAQMPRPFRCVKGDARDLREFADESFDIVFSNSVIEHVGEREDQVRMASELRRVGNGYWVQTPNLHFPLEPHYVFPFVQYAPHFLRVVVAKAWPFSFPKRQRAADVVQELASIRLLTEKDMRSLFPEAEIYRETLFGLTKSLVAYQFPGQSRT